MRDRANCHCPCHHNPRAHHIVPCCQPSAPPWLAPLPPASALPTPTPAPAPTVADDGQTVEQWREELREIAKEKAELRAARRAGYSDVETWKWS